VVATSIFATLGQKKATSSSWRSPARFRSRPRSFRACRHSCASDQASAHRRAGVSYESVRRALDLFALEYRPSTDRAAALKALGDVAAKLDAIAEAEPTVPQYIYDRVKWTPALASDFSTTAAPRPTS
jgi:hypothetical protein